MPAVKQAQLPETPPSNATHGDANRNGPGSNGNGRVPKDKPGPLLRLWRTIKSIYYASAPSWQVLKSGALLFFGFFCWSSANLLLSYEPSWQWTYVLMAYGFLLTWWGPLTHLLLVPRLIPWLRRQKRGSGLHFIGKKLTQINLTIFAAAIILLSVFPPDAMTVDFGSIVQSTRTADVNPTLECSRDATTVTCRLDDTEGADAITVESGGTVLLERQQGDFSFSLPTSDLVEVVGQRQFQVVVHAPDGSTVRRFTRTTSMIR